MMVSGDPGRPLLAAILLAAGLATPAAAQEHGYGGGYDYQPSYRDGRASRPQPRCSYRYRRVYDEERGYSVRRRVRICA